MNTNNTINTINTIKHLKNFSLNTLNDYTKQFNNLNFSFNDFNKTGATFYGHTRGKLIETTCHLINNNTNFNLTKKGRDFTDGDCKVHLLTPEMKPSGDIKISTADNLPYNESNVINKLNSFIFFIDRNTMTINDIRYLNINEINQNYNNLIKTEYQEICDHIKYLDDIQRNNKNKETNKNSYSCSNKDNRKINYRGEILVAKIHIDKFNKIEWSIALKGSTETIQKFTTSIFNNNDDVTTKDVNFLNSITIDTIENINNNLINAKYKSNYNDYISIKKIENISSAKELLLNIQITEKLLQQLNQMKKEFEKELNSEDTLCF